jgi:hypothetical protein
MNRIFLTVFCIFAAWLFFGEAIVTWEYAHLVPAPVPMGAGIAADVFAVTLLNAILFPAMFRKWWLMWVLAVGGSHALLPIIGQLSVIYLEPALLTMGVGKVWLEMAKTVATIIGCWLLWTFLKGVYEDGVRGSDVDDFTGLSFIAVWGCSADALYSGAVKGAPAIEYNWDFTEIVMSNVIAAGVVMAAAFIAVGLGLGFGKKMRKPVYQIGAFFVEFAVLGYFLIFFALVRSLGLYNWSTGTAISLPLEAVSAATAMTFVGWVFYKNRHEIVAAQEQRLKIET